MATANLLAIAPNLTIVPSTAYVDMIMAQPSSILPRFLTCGFRAVVIFADYKVTKSGYKREKSSLSNNCNKLHINNFGL
jgi:hypothetical protein